jgi:phage terminase small subunit
MIDAKTKSKNYYKAYQDYQAGNFTYEQLAKKYKVSPTTINTWRSRYWAKWDSQDSQNSGEVSQVSQDTSQAEDVKLDSTRPQDCLQPIVAKQVQDTAPARIYAEYSRDNLPEITDREARFVEEYLIDLDKKNAAIRAGFTIANADSMGCRLYARPDVNAHIQVALAERLKRSGMNADLAIRELGRIIRANPAKVIMGDGGINPNASEDDLACVSAVKVKTTPMKGGGEITEKETRFHDKVRATELYMKAAGMLIDRKQVDVTTRVEDMTLEQVEARKRELEKKLGIKIINVTPEP